MNCPNDDELRALLNLDLTTDFEAHVHDCVDCQRRLEELAKQGSPDVQDLRETAKISAFEPTECNQAIAAATRAATASTIGRWKLLYEIGDKGGMGQVWKAQHRDQPHVFAAVKMIRQDKVNVFMWKRLVREMRTVHKLGHPNIVAALDWNEGETSEVPYIAMELLEGFSGRQLLRCLGPLPVPEACQIAREVAQGLGYAHENGHIHRDVKPANLFITRQGRVKVCDFGLVTKAAAETETITLTQAGMGAGTPVFMPPEQMADAGSVTVAADIYSLGVTLLNLLTNKLRSGSLDERLKDLADHPSGLVDVLRKMLQPLPEQRYRSMNEVVDLLEAYAQGADLEAMMARADASMGSADAMGEPKAVGVEAEAAPGKPLPTPIPHIDFDILFWDEGRGQSVPIAEPHALPAGTGSKLQIVARADSPTYLYLLWISSDGVVQPLYPWKPGDWNEFTTTAPGTDVFVPARNLQTGRFEPLYLDTGAGLETLVVMASERRVAEDSLAGIGRRVAGVDKLPHRPAGAIWFDYRSVEPQSEGVAQSRIALGGGEHDPIFQLHSFLRAEVCPKFPLVRAVSFANLGKQES